MPAVVSRVLSRRDIWGRGLSVANTALLPRDLYVASVQVHDVIIYTVIQPLSVKLD